MAFLTVCVTAFIAALLTLFSGFGLGSLLLPPFALFFPMELAVAAVAVVHLANNLFKLVLVGKYADRRTVLVFGLPGLIGAVGGALVLHQLSKLSLTPLSEYSLGGRTCIVQPLGLTIGLLMVAFAFLEALPLVSRIPADRRLLPVGGLISGFFGGLSGHQGAFRSAFLVKSGLARDAFLGTGVACAVLIDLARLGVYMVTLGSGSASFFAKPVPVARLWEGNLGLLVASAIVSAFAGSYLGSRLFRKVTLRLVQRLVAGMLVVLGLAIAAGIIGT